MSISGPNMRSSDTAMDVDSLIEELQDRKGSEATIAEALKIGSECSSDGENIGLLAAAAWLIEDGGYLASDFLPDEKAEVLAAIEAELHYDRLTCWGDPEERRYELETFRSIMREQDPLGNVYAPIVELHVKLRRDYYATNQHCAVIVTEGVPADLAYEFIRQVQTLSKELLGNTLSPRTMARQARVEQLQARQAERKPLPVVEGDVSPRHQIAIELAHFIIQNDLTNPVGGDIVQDETARGKPRHIAFSKPRHLDGEVTVYGPNFIHIKYTTGFRDLPHQDERVFLSLQDTLNFLRLAFVEHKGKEALQIPVKPPKAI